ncbi:Carbamoyl-phosphate synthase L chain, ATP binding domain, partial [Candidatus Electrothrix communis]
MEKIGLNVPKSFIVHTIEDAMDAGDKIGFPVIVRPSFTLGGTGGGVAYNRQELREMCTGGLDLSMTTEIMLERSLLGWKEYELEVVRDRKDNVVWSWRDPARLYTSPAAPDGYRPPHRRFR